MIFLRLPFTLRIATAFNKQALNSIPRIFWADAFKNAVIQYSQEDKSMNVSEIFTEEFYN
jgi:hypothetical protein